MLQIEMNIFQSIKLSKWFHFYAYKILNRYINSRNLFNALLTKKKCTISKSVREK